MLSRRISLIRLPMIVPIILLALVAVLAHPSSVGAETASQRTGVGHSHTHAKTSYSKSKKHKSKKHKSKKSKSKKSKSKKKSPVIKRVAVTNPPKNPAKPSVSAPLSSPAKPSVSTPLGTVGDPYTYKNLLHHFTFSGTKVDPSVWGVYNTNGSWSNDKDARRPELVTVSDNTLHVTAAGPMGSGLCLCRTSVKPTTPYGRYEIRARTAANTDHGFAMLLWPNAENWPAGGEIDIAEYNAARSKLWTTVHYSASNKRYITGTPGDYTQWHTYGVEWTPAAITYYVDGVVVMTVSDPAAIPRQAMHLALQAGKNEGVKSPSNTSATLDVAWINEYS